MDDLSYLQLLLETRWAVLTSAHYILLILTLIEVRNNQTTKQGLTLLPTHVKLCTTGQYYSVVCNWVLTTCYLGFEIHT